MIKKILIVFILINLLIVSSVYATEEIISSQMEALNLSSFIKQGKDYTKDVFPDIDLREFLGSAIKGQVDNKGIIINILLLFGDEIITAISLLGKILIVIIIHSLLKSFTDNLNNGKGIGQIAYYVEYILIVVLIMTNFSDIINMIKESIHNLVGFVNCLIPILLALMTASRKCGISFFNTAINFIYNSIYWKYYNIINIATYINCYSIRNHI
ncbi:MAG: hypothetical protein Q4G09_03725 [Clostridia bacterium]|nr:hypothetical protein [Clostridia bacterium]